MRGKNLKWPLGKSFLPPFVVPTVLNLSFCQVPQKDAVIQNRKKTTKKNTAHISKFQKRQLGLEVGSLQFKMPYHVLKLSSVGEKKNNPKIKIEKAKKLLLQGESEVK